LPIGLKGNSDGSGAVQIGGSDAISISTGLNTTFAGTITATGTVAGTTGTLYPLVLGTSVSATGTAIDFTGIPSWVRRVTVCLGGVSTNGTSIVQVQLGSGSVQTSGYTCTSVAIEGTSAGSLNAASGFILDPGGSAAFLRSGQLILTNMGSNFWVASYNLLVVGAASARLHMGAGNAGFLSGALDRVRITTVNGTDAFDAGIVNILWE
jgi:hypothetical protein